LFPRDGQYQKIAVLSDFDGVISRQNVLEALYQEYSTVDWEHYVDLWSREELSAVEEIPACLGGVTAPRIELENFVSGLEIDAGFADLVQFCNSRGHFLAITSDGLKWYIKLLLKKNNINEIPVFANEIQFQRKGLTFSFPWYDPSTPLNGTSKAKITKIIQDSGYTVLFIGDGLSDKEAAKVADMVFAKKYLYEVMLAEGKSPNKFEDFHQIIRMLS